jgi:hypothetical protein
MKKFLRIMAVVVFILFIAVLPLAEAAKGGNGGGHGFGGGIGGGHGRGNDGAPEIDPGMASGAIGLLVGGVLMLTGKKKRKQRKDK